METKVQLGCDSGNREVWVVIKFLNAEKVSGNEIHSRLCAVNGEAAIMNKQNEYH